MKQGMGLEQAMETVERVSKAKRDFIAPVQAVGVRLNGGPDLVLSGRGLPDDYKINGTAEAQMRDFAGVPKVAWDHLRTHDPERLRDHVNHQLGKKAGEGRMLRTLDGRLRAFLSPSYRPLENIDFARAAIPILQNKGVRVLSANVDDDRLYLKGTVPSLRWDANTIRPGVHAFLKPGRDNVIEWGVVLSNSEVGKGSLSVETLAYYLACLNGAIGTVAMRKAHLGRREQFGDDASEFMSDESRAAEDRAFFLKARDVVNGVLTQDMLARYVQKIEAAAERKVEGNQLEAVARIGERLGLNQAEVVEVTNIYARQADFTAWGVANAITEYAQEESLDYAKATELEKMGGQIIELSQADWGKLVAQEKRSKQLSLAV